MRRWTLVFAGLLLSLAVCAMMVVVLVALGLV
jgi:hypothetical protein